MTLILRASEKGQRETCEISTGNHLLPMLIIAGDGMSAFLLLMQGGWLDSGFPDTSLIFSYTLEVSVETSPYLQSSLMYFSIL